MYERVAAVDVAKASGVVCLRTPDPDRPGRFVNRIWDNVPAMRAQIAELGRELAAHGVQLAGRNLEDIPGSDGLLKIRKVKGTIA